MKMSKEDVLNFFRIFDETEFLRLMVNKIDPEYRVNHLTRLECMWLDSGDRFNPAPLLGVREERNDSFVLPPRRIPWYGIIQEVKNPTIQFEYWDVRHLGISDRVGGDFGDISKALMELLSERVGKRVTISFL